MSPDDLLDQVLDGDQAVGAAVLVDDHRHVDAGRAHLQQQVTHPHRWRHEELPADHLGQRARAVSSPEPQEIAHMNHADDVVEGIAEHRQPRMPRLAHGADHLGDRRRLLDGDDVGARHHHVVDAKIAEIEAG